MWKITSKFAGQNIKTSQELRMLSRSLSDCKSLTLDVMFRNLSMIVNYVTKVTKSLIHYIALNLNLNLNRRLCSHCSCHCSHLQEAGPTGLSFAKSRSLLMIICNHEKDMKNALLRHFTMHKVYFVRYDAPVSKIAHCQIQGNICVPGIDTGGYCIRYRGILKWIQRIPKLKIHIVQ